MEQLWAESVASMSEEQRSLSQAIVVGLGVKESAYNPSPSGQQKPHSLRNED